MKYIFLDIDGVLNSTQSTIYHLRRKRWGLKLFKALLSIPRALRLISRNYYWFRLFPFYTFCPIACSNFQWLLDQTPKPLVVISSAWRNHFSFKEMEKILAHNGIKANVIGQTPSSLSYRPRGFEIREFIDNRKINVKDIVILDDNNDMNTVKSRLVQTDFYHGLQITDCIKALRKLGINSPFNTGSV